MKQTIPHLSKLMFNQAEKFGSRNFVFDRNDATAEWEPVSWRTFAIHTKLVAKALISLDVKEGDRIGIFSYNQCRHLEADFAIYAIKGVTVPIYPTSSAFQVKFIVEDAGIETIFVGEQEQVDIIARVADSSKRLKRVIVMDDNIDLSALKNALKFSDLLKMSLGAAIDAEFEERFKKESEDDLLSIIYTSGTTGRPKGVTFHQSNYTEFLRIHREFFPIVDKSDIVLSFLPLTHIFEKAWIYYCIDRGVTIYMNHLPSEIEEHLKEVRPTAMCAVPRFWEKIYATILKEAENANHFSEKYFFFALRLGKRYNLDFKRLGKHAQKDVSAYYKIFARPLFNKIKKRIGIDRGRFFPCAGAKLSNEINEFFHAMSINLAYGYGLTESTASVSCFPSNNVNYKIGSVGRIMPGVKVRISQDGEILLKAKTITKGYYNDPDANARAFTEDGWFRTGDAGFIDMNDNLYITDRIKDMFKTAGGKFIAPQLLEGLITNDPMVCQAVAIGTERKYVSMLIVPAFDELEKWAKEQGIKYKSLEDLLSEPEVQKLYRQVIDLHTGKLARYEQIKRFTLLPHKFTVEQGHLTSTMKIRRNVISNLYAEVIEAMYD